MKERLFKYPIPKGNWQTHLLRWADKKFPCFTWLNGNAHQYPESPFENLFFAGNRILPEAECLIENKGFKRAGIISYDYKNRLEQLESKNRTIIELPDLLFFQVDLEIRVMRDHLISNQELKEGFWNNLEEKFDKEYTETNRVTLKSHSSKNDYLESFRQIQNQIIEGNTYELNFCQAFSADFESLDPIDTYFRLNRLSPMPFSVLFKAESKWLISASPERYLKKTGKQLISQPIKGTIRRGASQEEDEINKAMLFHSEKERAENLMITDLTRNDLSKVSETGSVEVPELFGIYQLPKVFQMISTVSSTLKPGVDLKEIIRATFPMGSMTGAPKIKTMELIDYFENFKRGWFSGAFGWIDEKGNFDFTVIIRSIIADMTTKKLYFAVGSAITIDSEAEAEYEECLLKASAIMEVLRGK